jgi:hypothetical protein
MRIMAGVGDLVQRTEMVARTIERSGDAVYGLHHERGARVSWLSLKTKVDGLLVVDLKTTGTVFSRSTSKLMTMVFFGFTSKLVVTVSPNLGSKLVVEGFLIWASKPATTVW